MKPSHLSLISILAASPESALRDGDRTERALPGFASTPSTFGSVLVTTFRRLLTSVSIPRPLGGHLLIDIRSSEKTTNAKVAWGARVNSAPPSCRRLGNMGVNSSRKNNRLAKAVNLHVDGNANDI